MKCLRCGYCCTSLITVIVIDPDKGLVVGNLRGINQLEERCPHLRGDTPGEYSCAVHDYPWFKKTGCGEYQSHYDDSVECRVGRFVMDNKEEWVEARRSLEGRSRAS